MSFVYEPDFVRDTLLHFAEEELDYESFSAFVNMRDNKGRAWDVEGLGPVILADCKDYDSYKSYDGWHENVWIVFDINGILYRIKGKHTSYTGTEWEDNMTIVKPQLKQVIEFVDA